MVARARKTGKGTSKPYPYERDDTLSGTKVRIKGEQGILSIVTHEFNPRNGKHWFVLWKAGCGWRHKHPADVTPVKRGQRLV